MRENQRAGRIETDAFIWEWLFPQRCPICGEVVPAEDGDICSSCREKLPLLKAPHCMKCGRQIAKAEEEFCSNCSQRKRSFEAGISGYSYHYEPIARLIAQVKYHHAVQLLEEPCRRLAEAYEEWVRACRITCLVPVPLYAAKKRLRGFNQAEEIARRLGRIWELPVRTEWLKRTRKTTPQKLLREEERLRNLLEAFFAEGEELSGERILLVDDILTTGSTMEACTRMLKQAGAEAVFLCSLAS